MGKHTSVFSDRELRVHNVSEEVAREIESRYNISLRQVPNGDYVYRLGSARIKVLRRLASQIGSYVEDRTELRRVGFSDFEYGNRDEGLELVV